MLPPPPLPVPSGLSAPSEPLGVDSRCTAPMPGLPPPKCKVLPFPRMRHHGPGGHGGNAQAIIHRQLGRTCTSPSLQATHGRNRIEDPDCAASCPIAPQYRFARGQVPMRGRERLTDYLPRAALQALRGRLHLLPLSAATNHLHLNPRHAARLAPRTGGR